MVEWYRDAWSPTPNRDQLEVAMIARSHHKTWLNNLTHIDLDMVEQLYMPIKTLVEGENTLHQVLISIRSKTNYACNVFLAEKRSEKPMNGTHACGQTIVETGMYTQ